MGGDHAPDVVLEGALIAVGELDDASKLVLFGDKATIDRFLAGHNVPAERFEAVHTSEVIEMTDHASKAYSEKKDSSIRTGFSYLKSGRIDGFASAGATGAMMVGAMYAVEKIRNVIRPAISALISTTGGGKFVLLDVGLNVDCRPDVLDQYGVIGSTYAKAVLGLENPRVAMLNVGGEREKGNLTAKAAHELMSNNQEINFTGNIEANEIFSGQKADVVVCDGFVGNTILKLTEGFYEMARLRGIQDEYIDKLNYEVVGGTAVLGINAVVVIGHGRSSALAVKNMILQTETTIKRGLVHQLQDIFYNF